MNNNAATTKYPIWLKTILKTTPAFCVFFMFGGLFTTCIYDVVYHPHDRIERYHFRSNKFERLARKRDEKLRYYYAPALDWQPHTEPLVQNRPLNRF